MRPLNHKLVLVLSALALFLALGLSRPSRGILFHMLFYYKMTQIRDLTAGFTNKKLVVRAMGYGGNASKKNANLHDIIRDVLKFTDEHLSFATTNTSNDPDKLLKYGKAHCVGYAAFFKAAIETIIHSQNIRDVEVYHAVGKVHFLGVDLHRFTKNSFLKDHDYNIVVDLQGEKTHFVDPSLHDRTGIGFVRGDPNDNRPNKTLQRTAKHRR